jgi:hypothetical protein
MTCSSFAFAQSITDGGLTAPELGWSLSPNLLVNGDFSLGTTGWKLATSCFSLDSTTPAPNGAISLKLTNPATCSVNAPVAVNSFQAAGGQLYTLSGQIKTDDLTNGNVKDGAVFEMLGAGRTQSYNGTADWTTATLQQLSVATGQTANLRLGTYGYPLPSGTAWYANLSLQQEMPPLLQTFLLYPNYRGLMFSDQSQLASMDLSVNPPAGMSLSSLVVELDAVDAGGNTVLSQTLTPTPPEFTGSLDLSALPAGTYLVSGKLLDATGDVLATQAAYAIVKLDASLRAGMKAWVDPANLAHFIDGNPHFVFGIYDTTGFSYLPAAYTKELAAIAEAPINMVINYFLTNAPTPTITAYTTAMHTYGITFLPDLSGFYAGNKAFPTGIAKEFGTSDPDQLTSDYVSAFSSDPGVVGYYVQDEPVISLQPETFHQYSLVKASDPSGFSFAVIDHPLDLYAWKDTVDVLGVDPYPITLATGNDLSLVADETRAAVQAVHGARPVWTVIQFFKATSVAAWPTEQQLHDMSWMAVVEGASGLFYWSYGARALEWVKDPVEHAALYQELIDVTNEIKSLEPVLLSPDAAVISANSESGTVFTKTKLGGDGTRYLFAYNHSAAVVTAEFTLEQPAGSVIDYDTGVDNPPDTSTTFSATFQPYQAHVLVISDSAPSPTPTSLATPTATPTPSPTLSPTPSPTASSLRTPIPSSSATSTTARTATATAARTATATATRTAGATRTPTVTPTATPTATPGALSISPADLKFKMQKVGGTSSPKILQVANDGAAAVKITTLAVTGDFAQSNTCATSLAAHGTCSISVIFKRTAAGKRPGYLRLKDDATNSPQMVNLTGSR